jgi:hypothetical protein
MSTAFCSVCGAVLRNGVCPNGHPQRAARRSQARRRRRWPWVLLILFLLLAGGAYAALRWYPQRAAGDLMRPSSVEYADALTAYRAAVEAVPPAGDDAQAVIDGAQAVLDRADAARTILSEVQIALEERAPPDFPVISSRTPLDEAIGVRQRMLRFYTAALRAVADLESVAGYLTEVSGTLSQLDDLEDALRGVSPGEIAGAVEVAIPISNQLNADLEALTPPEELGSLHASLQAIADQVAADLEEAGGTGRPSAEPVIRALIGRIEAEMQSFRAAIAGAPDTAFTSQLGRDLRRVETIVRRIDEGLTELENAGVNRLTIPRVGL